MADYPSMQRAGAAKAELVNTFMRGVYGWMGAGLGVTALVSLATSNSPALLGMLFNVDPATGQVVGLSMTVIVLLFAELGLVFYLSRRLATMNPSTATTLFLVYSGLNGLTLTPILLAYTAESVFATFVTTAGMFGAMSVYGLVTKKDLTAVGSFAIMGLWGLLIGFFVNLFLQSSTMAFVLSGIGVVVFLGMTAYDTQFLKTMGEQMPSDAAAVRRGSILGALKLYLDFINLFLMLLQFMGDRR